MKTTLVNTKTKPPVVAAMSAIAMAAVLVVPAKAQTLVNYNFNSLTPGSINGQDGWSSANGTYNTPVQVATTPVNAGGGGTLGLTNGLEDKGSAATKTFFSAGSLTTSSVVTLTFEAIQVTVPTVAQFGLGTDGVQNFGIWNGTLAIRSQAGTFIAKTATGFDVAPITNHWYSFQSVWDLSTATATLLYRDLTAGDTGYTQLFFDQAQTQASVSLGSINPTTWNGAWVRLGKTGTSGIGYGTGYLDNLSAVAVPEPSALALGVIGAGALAIVRARSRFFSSL